MFAYVKYLFLNFRSLIVVTTIVTISLLGSSPVYADHDVEHQVQNMKGGLGALEQRVWDCEHGIAGACPGTTGPQGEQGPAGVNVAAGQQCTEGAVIGFDQDGNIICSSVSVTYVIGDFGPAGGIVFYVYGGGLHGLEAAPANQSSGAEWGCDFTEIDGADETGVGFGAQNTADILAGCSESGIAAEIADNYSLNSYDDWFLPSKDELNLLYQQKDVVGGFASDVYWSSAEGDSSTAWYQYFSDGLQDYGSRNYALRVRAVRAF